MDDMLFYGYPFLLLIMMALSALGGGPQCSLALTYVSFVALALSAHIVWRRLRWVPVAGSWWGSISILERAPSPACATSSAAGCTSRRTAYRWAWGATALSGLTPLTLPASCPRAGGSASSSTSPTAPG